MAIIREAVAHDALGITIVGAYTWKTTYVGLMPEELIDARIRDIAHSAANRRVEIDRNGGFFVAEEEGTLVGFCCCGASRNADYAEAGKIYGLYVLKGFQGTGLGKRLFCAVAGELAQNGYAPMIVNCHAGNPSIGFYEKMGGTVVGRRQDVTRDGYILTEDILYFGDIKSFCAPQGEA
jgi:GNAT superfamily N-acetyltransferase